MKVVISKTHLKATSYGLREVTTKLAGYDVPDGKATTVYVDGEPALVIEP
jgi:hypothetical protein